MQTAAAAAPLRIDLHMVFSNFGSARRLRATFATGWAARAHRSVAFGHMDERVGLSRLVAFPNGLRLAT